MRLTCTTNDVVHKRFWALLLHSFASLSFFLHLLLTHFRGTQEAGFYHPAFSRGRSAGRQAVWKSKGSEEGEAFF